MANKTTVSSLKLNHLNVKNNWERNRVPLFKDQDVQREFDNQGYVVLPVLNASEVDSLMHFYNSLPLNDETGFGFHASNDNVDKTLVANIMQKLIEVAFPKVASHLFECKPIMAGFKVKEPNLKSIVPIHQDWTFIDYEDKYSTVTFWIPLQDVTFENGALGLIKGSHRYFNVYNPSPSRKVYAPASEHTPTIFPYLQIVELKAGEALVFDNRTFHGGPPNASNKKRIVCAIELTHKEAQMRHYYVKPSNPSVLQEYAIDEHFFRKYENNVLADMFDKGEVIQDYPMLSELPYVIPDFSEAEMIEVMELNGNVFSQRLFDELHKLMPKQEAQCEPKRHESSTDLEYETKWVDQRPFFEKYTPSNILRQIRKKLDSQ